MAKLILPAGAGPRLEATCPGAKVFDGPVGDTVSVCGPLKRDRDLEGSVVAKGDPMSVTFSTREDAKQVLGFCCGDYESCGIWQAERRRVSHGYDRFSDMPEHQLPATAGDPPLTDEQRADFLEYNDPANAHFREEE